MTTNVPDEPNLPDDVRRWPTDPKKLFGLRSNATRRDLKLAYTKLIRRYKPEHAPEQFQRLRAAFEALDQQFEFQALFKTRPSFHSEEDSAATPAPDEAKDEQSNENAKSFRPEPVRPAADLRLVPKDHFRTTKAGQGNDAELIWQQALDGSSDQQAYDKLTALGLRQQLSAIQYAQLYWLLNLAPELNPTRSPIQWLMEGIRRHGMDGLLFRLLSNEVRRSPRDASELIADDVYNLASTPDQVIRLAELRWSVARPRGLFFLIRADLNQHTSQFMFDPNAWLRLVMTAFRKTVLFRSQLASTTLIKIRELLKNTSTHEKWDDLWNEFDWISELHEVWEKGSEQIRNSEIGVVRIKTVSEESVITNRDLSSTRFKLSKLFELVESTWDRPMFEIGPELLSFCDLLLSPKRDPLVEMMAITQTARPLVSHLLQLIRDYQNQCRPINSHEPTEASTKAFDRFVDENLTWGRYHPVKVLRFCLTQASVPSDIVSVLDEDYRRRLETDFRQRSDDIHDVVQLIRNELSVACLAEARRLLW